MDLDETNNSSVVPDFRGPDGLRQQLDTQNINEDIRQPTSDAIDQGDGDCECRPPKLELTKDELGPFDAQLLWCSTCEKMIGMVVAGGGYE